MIEKLTSIESAESLSEWNKKAENSPRLSATEAKLIFDHIVSHKISLLTDENDHLYWKEAGSEKIQILLDDVIDQVCDWNYQDIRDMKALSMNSESFSEYCKYDDKLKDLKETEKILNKLYEDTVYGKQLTSRMRDLVVRTWGQVNMIPVLDLPQYEDKVRTTTPPLPAAASIAEPRPFTYHSEKGQVI